MMNKRDFLKGGATALVSSGAMTSAVAAVRPSLNRLSGQASWQAHVGRSFQVDGHEVTLKAVVTTPSRQPGEQFSLSFAGRLPDHIGNRQHLLTGDPGEPVLLYFARTVTGLRADFCRLQG